MIVEPVKDKKKIEALLTYLKGVSPTFPTKPPLRHKIDKYLILHPLQ